MIGLDVSLTDTGFVILEYANGNWSPSHVASVATDPHDSDHARQAFVVGTVLRQSHTLAKRHRRDRIAVCIEDYGTSKFQGKLHERIEIVGALKYAYLTVLGFDVFMATPNAVKKFMGSGRHKKDDMINAAANTFKFRHDNHNVVDAYCCARYLIANRVNSGLTITRASPILSLSFLQTPASGEPGKVAKLPLTKNLQRLSVNSANTASRQ